MLFRFLAVLCFLLPAFAGATPYTPASSSAQIFVSVGANVGKKAAHNYAQANQTSLGYLWDTGKYVRLQYTSSTQKDETRAYHYELGQVSSFQEVSLTTEEISALSIHVGTSAHIAPVLWLFAEGGLTIQKSRYHVQNEVWEFQLLTEDFPQPPHITKTVQRMGPTTVYVPSLGAGVNFGVGILRYEGAVQYIQGQESRYTLGIQLLFK